MRGGHDQLPGPEEQVCPLEQSIDGHESNSIAGMRFTLNFKLDD